MSARWALRVPVLLSLAASSTALASDGVAGDFEVTPGRVDVALPPCHVQTVPLTVNVASGATMPKVDVYLLADTTGSMQPVLDATAAGALDIVQGLRDALPGVDLRFGVGQYRDFPPQPFAFDHQLSPTSDATKVSQAIDAWAAEGGGDAPEGQMFALDQLAHDDDPAGGTIGWRQDAERIVVWFGDAPGHDPICSEMSGLDYDVTEASVTDALRAAGLEVLAISTVTGYPEGLDDDPVPHSWQYIGVCGAGGEPGQATRITDATGGTHVMGVEADQIVGTIQDLVTEQVDTIDRVSVAPHGGVARFVSRVSDPVGPVDPYHDAELPFEVQLTGSQTCGDDWAFVGGKLDVLADGSRVASTSVQLRLPPCELHASVDVRAPRPGAPRGYTTVVVHADRGFHAGDELDVATATYERTKPVAWTVRDVDGDGLTDVTLWFRSGALHPRPGAPEGRFAARTTWGQPVLPE